MIAGVCLVRRKPLGGLLTIPILILCTLIGAVVIRQYVVQTLVGLVFPPQIYIGMIRTWIAMGGFSIRLIVSSFRNLEPPGGDRARS